MENFLKTLEDITIKYLNYTQIALEIIYLVFLKNAVTYGA